MLKILKLNSSWNSSYPAANFNVSISVNKCLFCPLISNQKQVAEDGLDKPTECLTTCQTLKYTHNLAADTLRAFNLDLRQNFPTPK